MIRRRRKQRAASRSKIRRQRFVQARSFLFGKFAVVVLMAAAGIGVHRFLFVSDFFMIKSLGVSDLDPMIASEMKARLARLKGKSAFNLNLKNAEQEGMKHFPQLSSLKIARVFPDSIRVEYQVRKPVAFVRSQASQIRSEKARILGQTLAHRDEGPISALDAEGVVFPAALTAEELARLPEISVPSAEDRKRALGFLAAWKAAESERREGSDPLTVRKLTLDSWNELNVYVHSPAFAENEPTRIVWGAYEDSTFERKYQRLRDVWQDLVAKSMAVEYVNLRGVPQRVQSALEEDLEVVGRVIVRPKVKVFEELNKRKPNRI